MPELATTIWADGPSSAPIQPQKHQIRAWGKWIEQIITAFTSNGGLIYSSLALLNSDLAKAANTMAWVFGDPVADNNGVYGKIGASGTGSWTRRTDLPFSFIVASDSGAGSPNAIQATTAIPVSPSALVWMNVAQSNTSSPVTVSFNGGSPLAIKTNAGADVGSNGLSAGMIILGIVSGTSFRLLSDQSGAAIVAAAEAAAAAAIAAASSVQSEQVSRANAIANYHPTSAPTFFRTSGYNGPADGAPRYYQSFGSEPAAIDDRFQLTLGGGASQWYADPYAKDYDIGIGPGSDFPTWQAAIDRLSRSPLAPGRRYRLVHEAGTVITHGLKLAHGDFRKFVLDAEDATLHVDSGFLGVDNSDLVLNSGYYGTDNLMVGLNADMPSLACLVDMHNLAGHGINISISSMLFEQGAGVINAGKSGIYGQVARVHAIGTDFHGANYECVRMQQASGSTFQGANAGEGVKAPGASGATASLFVSRASNVQFQDGIAKNSHVGGVEVHRAWLSATDADFSGAALDGIAVRWGSHFEGHRVKSSNNGRYGVNLGEGAYADVQEGFVENNIAGGDFRCTGGGNTIVSYLCKTTNGTGNPHWNDMTNFSGFNIPNERGVVYANVVFNSATIASDAITLPSGALPALQIITIDTQGGTATDLLSTIDAGVVGQTIVLRSANANRDVTVKHNIGNLRLTGGADKLLDGSENSIVLQRTADSVWRELSRN